MKEKRRWTLLSVVLAASVLLAGMPALEVDADTDFVIADEDDLIVTDELTEDDAQVLDEDNVCDTDVIATSYIDHNVSGSGENTKAVADVQTCSCYTLINDTTTLENGIWYVLGTNINYNSRIEVAANATANLILSDNCTLTAESGITVNSGSTLNIYAQSDGNSMGKLIVPMPGSQTDYFAGIGGGSFGAACGTINIHGGDIQVNGCKGAAIGGARGGTLDGQTVNGGTGGTVTIYGGKVSAKAGDTRLDAGIGGGGSGAEAGNGGDGGMVTIYGGIVNADSSGGAAIGGGGATANADNNKAGKGAMVTIYGGKVVAGAGDKHAIGGGGENATDGALILGTNVKLYGGNSSNPEDSEANLIPKLSDDYERYKYMTAIYTKPAPAPVYTYYTVNFDMQGHGEQISSQSIRSGSRANRPADPKSEGLDFGGWFTDPECTQEYDFSKPVYNNLTLYAAWTPGLVSVRITTPPAITDYIEGEVFNPEGMVVTAVYLDGSEKPVTDYMYTPNGELKISDTKVTVSYTKGEITRTADQTINVKIRVPESALYPTPNISGDTMVLYIVKGQRITMPEKGWKAETKEDEKYISISKNGLLKGKKAGKAVMSLVKTGEEKRSITVNVCEPTIKKSVLLTIGENESGEMKLSGYDPEHYKVFWVSSAVDVATVDQSGIVTPVGKGKTTVTAYINGRAYKGSVTVKESQTAKERTLHILVGGSKTITIPGLKKKPVWSSANENIATFDKSKVKALAVGETVLTATVADGTEYKVYLTVEDITLSGDGLGSTKSKNKYKLTLKPGDRTQLTFANVKQQVDFKSSKPDIAFVDENGLVTAFKSGKCKFTAKVDGKTITVDVVVNN